ncbi:MAG: macro domain-containing protein [bacterium]|nr:macro domain-containing protein [bacterium]
MSIFIQIKKGSVVDQSVEAIVCSANNWLVLGTGNAGEIREAGGEAIQRECDKIIKENQNKPLAIGMAVATGTGKLKKLGFRLVIHAIGLGYKRKENNKLYERIPATLKTIRSSVKNTLTIAGKAKITSIAFPLMCARLGYNAIKSKNAPEAILHSMIKEIGYFGKKKQSNLKVIICLTDEHFSSLGYKI